MIIQPQPGAQSKFLSTSADIGIYGGSAGSGKNITLDTPIATLKINSSTLDLLDIISIKWTTMGEIAIGDTVFDCEGNPCKVTAKSEIIHERTFRMEFDCGEVIFAGEGHLWITTTDRERRRSMDSMRTRCEPYSTKTTLSIHNSIHYFQDHHSIRYAMPLNIPTECWKHLAQWTDSSSTPKHHHIVSVTEVDSLPTQCISVDSPSRTYLVGKSMIPTHNSYALLIEPLRHIHNPNFGCVIFRREMKELTMEGGLVSKAMSIYPYLGATYRSQPAPSFTFPSGSRISFGHLNAENEVMAWKGSEICCLEFDEVDGFTDFQVQYMQSRNRSTCGVRPYTRMSCNPSAESWLAQFISWWIDQETGYPIKERSGVLRYVMRIDGKRVWGSSREELVETYHCEYDEPKSVTFIPAKITDNKILMETDPGYLSNLKGLDKVSRARLLDGNWLVRAEAGMYFHRDEAIIIDWKPEDSHIMKWVRSWDLASSEETDGRNVDWTVGLLGGRRTDGKIVIAEMIRVRRKADDVQTLIKNVALRDGKDTFIVLPQDPGQAGVFQKQSYQRMLNGFTVISRPITKNKLVMAASGADSPAALWQRGQIELVRGDWNKLMIDELDAFPTPKMHDDICDALSALVRNMPGHARPNYNQTGLSGRFKPVYAPERNKARWNK